MTNRRWDLFKPVWESSSASLSQTPLSVPEALPLSVTNVSRASRPVLMTPEELRVERQAHASGIFVAYHHQVIGAPKGWQRGAVMALVQCARTHAQSFQCFCMLCLRPVLP